MGKKSGFSHWIHQRITAFMMVILLFWIVYFVYMMNNYSTSEFINQLNNLFNMLMFVITCFVLLYHSSLGMVVIIEDYINNIYIRYVTILLVRLISVVTVIALIISLRNIYIL
ncbi:MAG TPA: succinate dehydrogenase, hydrophobic membrane anchor protein [Candidatus Megaira endosymbiont of Hartmannula sinica]|nr:succinate dehydrogenase, hydrophobic membrane anchor protein [Candidatus Megaera endosymbiont of Hartmannula sinica]